MSKQLYLSKFPQPGPSLISIDNVFERMGSIFCPDNDVDLAETRALVDKIRSRNTTNKVIRLAKDMARQTGPMMLDHNDQVRSILGVKDLSDERIDSVKPFKEILFKKVITKVTFHNNKYIIETKKVRR